MISAASDSIMQDYAQSFEYQGYALLKEDNFDVVLDLMREQAGEGDPAELEKILGETRKEFPQTLERINKEEDLIRSNGFEEYFNRAEIKEKLMTEVVRYLIENPEETAGPPVASQLQYAFNAGIQSVLTGDQYELLAGMARQHDPTNDTFREADLVVFPEKAGGTLYLDDPKQQGFIFNTLNRFVRNLYANDFVAKGN